MPLSGDGTYTGDGTDSRLISLGFQPKALLVMREEGYSARPYTDDYYGGLACREAGVPANQLWGPIIF